MEGVEAHFWTFFHSFTVVCWSIWITCNESFYQIMKSSIVWDVTPCSLVELPAAFVNCFLAGFLGGVLFDPEDGCNMYVSHSTSLDIPDNSTLHNHYN
jgi:hypothetical protein